MQIDENFMDVQICAEETEVEVDAKEKDRLWGMRSVFEDESLEFEGTELLSRLNLRLLVNQEEKDSMHVYEGQRARILLEKADSNKELRRSCCYLSGRPICRR